MQFGPLIGIAVALIAIIGGNAMEGGHFGSMLGLSAAIIVLGGTIGATIVQFPGGPLLGAGFAPYWPCAPAPIPAALAG